MTPLFLYFVPAIIFSSRTISLHTSIELSYVDCDGLAVIAAARIAVATQKDVKKCPDELRRANEPNVPGDIFQES